MSEKNKKAEEEPKQPTGPVTMYLHEDGWLRADRPKTENGKAPEEVRFEEWESFMRSDGITPRTAYDRKYVGFFTPDMCGEPQVFGTLTSHGYPKGWPGGAAFHNDFHKIVDVAEVTMLPKEETHVCVLCNHTFRYSYHLSYDQHTWPSYYEHYVDIHRVVPPADFYALVRDYDIQELVKRADEHLAWEVQHIQEALISTAVARKAQPGKHMTPADLRKFVRPIFPPPYAWERRQGRANFIKDLNKKIEDWCLVDEKTFDAVVTSKFEITNKTALKKMEQMKKEGYVEVEAFRKYMLGKIEAMKTQQTAQQTGDGSKPDQKKE